MLAKTLEINWHDGQAIYSIDFSSDGSRYATAGADNSVRIWNIHKRLDNNDNSKDATHLEKKTQQQQSKQLVDSLPVNIDFFSELKRHSSPVNVVRFSPSGDYVASAGDDACIIIWKLSPTKESTFGSDYNDYEKETWTVVHMFYGHNKEIYDLAWSPCGNYFITASIDNTARVWCLSEKTCIHVFADHTHYVQGVTWDPLEQYVATQSSDRSMAIYRYRKNQAGKLTFGAASRKHTRLDKGKIATTPVTTTTEDSTSTTTINKGSFRLYHDENLVSFFRRLSFSPDGAFLITPAGLNKPTAIENNEMSDCDENEELQNCAYIYPRNTLLKHPIGLIGNHPKPSIAIRWCSQLLKRRKESSSKFALPYRMLYATATQDSVYIYDTQQSRPICAISGMHFAPITDLAWSHDGSVLMFSSADGYCSAAVFSDGELGSVYEKLPEPAQEYDVEMMDVAQHQTTNSTDGHNDQVEDLAKPQKRRASLVIPNNQVVATPEIGAIAMTDSIVIKSPVAVIATAEKTKKRRITPILISSTLPSSTK